MKLHKLSLLTLFLCAASTQVCAADFWKEDVWKNQDRGFLYYPDEEKPKPKKPPFKDLKSIQSAEELKAEHAFRLANASFNPTEENVLAFQEVNYFVQEKASLFTDVYRRTSWQNPQFDFSTLNPAANFAQVALNSSRAEQKKEDIRSLTQSWGLMYFYRSDCRFCEIQSPLIKRLQTEYGFELLAVSLDGSANPHFPDALPDNGVSQLLTNGEGLSRVPALFMVKSDKSQSYLVSSGVLSLEDMLSRIQTLALKSPGQSLFGGKDALSSHQNAS